jgi:hypothetical protein
LEIHGVALYPGDSPVLLGSIGSVLLPPDGYTSFTATWSPVALVPLDAEVQIGSNDDTNPALTIPLTGNAVASPAALEARPVEINFGTVYVGCEAAESVMLHNGGGTSLDVTAITVDGSDTLGVAADTLPLTLNPSEDASFDVTFSPLAEGTVTGAVTVASSAGDTGIPVTAQAVAYGVNTDTFEVRDEDVVDVVFSVDTSSSMLDELAAMEAAFPDLLTALDGQDYQVAIVTQEDGCVIGSVSFVHPGMDASDQATALGEMLRGEVTTYAEAGFTLLEAAFTSTNLGAGGCNEGLIREDARLLLVGVTDEVEQSANPWSYYVSLFQSLKADPNQLTISAIAPDYPSGCDGLNGGQGWYEATVATGGDFLSICATDWASHFETLLEASGLTDSFELSGWPVEGTMVVTVNGEEVEGWTYAAGDNAVELDPPPPEGAVVEITYVVYGDCE